MTLTSDIILPIEFSEAEQKLLKHLFSDPVVIKYLKSLGQESSRELLELGILDMSDEAIARRHTLLTGKLLVVSTLLSIHKS